MRYNPFASFKLTNALNVFLKKTVKKLNYQNSKRYNYLFQPRKSSQNSKCIYNKK